MSSPRPSAPPGQRCSALRLLCVQEDVADRIVAMIAGAARELERRRSARAVHPRRPGDRRRGASSGSTAGSRDHGGTARAVSLGRSIGRCRRRHLCPADHHRARPRARSDREVFGPILHVVRWRADGLDALLDDIDGNGTVSRSAFIRASIPPSTAWSRGSPTATLRQPQYDRRGGRHAAVRRHRAVRYRPEGRRPQLSARFATEQVVTINTAAAGGNASLLAAEE